MESTVLASYAMVSMLEKGRILNCAKSPNALSFSAVKPCCMGWLLDKESLRVSVSGLNRGEWGFVLTVLASADYANLIKTKTIVHLRLHH